MMDTILKNTAIKTSIKIVSSMLMTGAIALVSFKVYATLLTNSSPSLSTFTVNALTIVAILAIIAHSIEGLWAGAIAYRRGQNALKTGIYTFFTGFVGLFETIHS